MLTPHLNSGTFQALDHSIEKTIRLNKFFSEAAQVQMEFSKKLRDITNKHQQKFTQVWHKSIFFIYRAKIQTPEDTLVRDFSQIFFLSTVN